MTRGPAASDPASGVSQAGTGLEGFSLSFLTSPLVRNGYALIASTGLSSALGLLYWIIAARFYSVEEVGVGTALLAMLLTLGNFAQLAFGNMVNRYLPVAGPRSTSLVVGTSAATMALAALIAIAFLLTCGTFAPSLSTWLNKPWPMFWFTVSSVLWALFALQDNVFAGFRRSEWVPAKNAIFSVTKILLLFPFVGSGLFINGIFAAWTVPLVVIVVAANLIIFFKLIPKARVAASYNDEMSLKALTSFFGLDYFGTLALVFATSAVPIIIIDIDGVGSAAVYNLAWTMSFSLYLIGKSMSVSLMAECAANRDRVERLISDAVAHTLVVLIPGMLVAIAGAHYIMMLFGPEYRIEGAPLLRVLVLACLPWSLVSIWLAVARAENRLVSCATVQVATSVLAIATGVPLILMFGPIGMGWAWVIAHSSVAVGIVAHRVWRHGISTLVVDLMNLASALSRISVFAGRSMQMLRIAPRSTWDDNMLLSQLESSDGEKLLPLRSLHSQSDVTTTFVGPDALHPRYLHKQSHSRAGAESLLRSIETMRRLRNNPGNGLCGITVPEVLVVERNADGVQTIEMMAPGEDGRSILAAAHLRHAGLAAALRAVICMHTQEHAAGTVDESWLARWIDTPAGKLRSTVAALMSGQKKQNAIDAGVSELRSYWSLCQTKLGLGHGDYCPGNILFVAGDTEHPPSKPSARDLKVAAVIDWDRASEDAPAGFDACYLLLTTRALVNGQEIGEVVRTMLQHPQWTEAETNTIAAATGEAGVLPGWARDPESIRAMCLTAWLHHVAANLEKSERYANNRLWVAWNVERVLDALTHTTPGEAGATASGDTLANQALKG